MSSISALGRSPGGGRSNPFQYSCLKKPMIEEPGRLQSIGLQRVRHDLRDLVHAHTLSHYCLEPQNIFVSEIVISFSDYKLCQTVHPTSFETISKIPMEKQKANNKNNLVKKE